MMPPTMRLRRLAATFLALTAPAILLSRPPAAGAQAEAEPAREESAEASPPNPLEAAIAGMRAAQQRIEDGETGSETRAIQQRVVDELDKLIQAARQNAARSQQRRPAPSQSDEDSEDRRDSAQPGENLPTPSERDRTDQSADSQQRRLDGQTQPVDVREQGAAAQVWGHLPERLRQRLRNIDAGKTLPKYSELVRRYFESLAEQGRTDETR